MFLRLWRDRSGSSVIEYSFLITIMIALVVVAIVATGNWFASMWEAFLAVLP
jgi:Flp pilus assembly pilin Flp